MVRYRRVDMPELPDGYKVCEQPAEPLLTKTIQPETTLPRDLVIIRATVAGLNRIVDRLSKFTLAVKQVLSRNRSELETKRLALPKLSRKILKIASTDADLLYALAGLNHLKVQVRAERLTPEAMGCSSSVLDAILKSAKAVQLLK